VPSLQRLPEKTSAAHPERRGGDLVFVCDEYHALLPFGENGPRPGDERQRLPLSPRQGPV